MDKLPRQSAGVRKTAAGAFLLLLLGLGAPAGQAAINDPMPFRAELPFSEGLGAGAMQVVSGRLEAQLASAEGTWGFFNTTGAAVVGLRQACWSATQCTQSPGDDVAVVVLEGGSFGLSVPDTSDGRLEAAHALGLFVDFGGQDDLNSFTLGRSLVAPVVDGQMAFTRITPIPPLGPLQREGGGVTALDEATVINVYRGDTLVASRPGKVDPVTFSGSPRIEPFGVESAIVPFGGSSVAYFSPAGERAAKAGLDLRRIQSLSQDVEDAQEGQQAGGGEGPKVGFGGFGRLLAEVLNGAILGVPNDAAGSTSFAEAFVFVRFTRLAVAAEGEGLAWQGRAALQMQEGEVKGAEPLYGVSFLALPWWSYLLWGLAIVALVVRHVLKSPRKSERWDRLRWVGWVAGGVAFVLVFVLWDRETNAVWGTSILTTDAGGKALFATALVQLLPLSLVMFATAAPLRMLLRNGLMMARQGTFMNLSGPVASLLGYFLGAHLLLSYLELILVQVIEKLG